MKNSELNYKNVKMMKRKKALIIFGFLPMFIIFTGMKASYGQNSGRIYGSVEDVNTNEKLLFANVVLVNASDSVQMTGTASDANGNFEFKRINKGTYFVQVSTLGYHLKNSEVFTISDNDKEINTGIIKLSPLSELLNEVVVVAKRPLINMEPGKVVMNVAENATSQTDNVYDLLRKFPGISIDNNDNISLNGKSGIMVMVDDRPTYMTGESLANYLKSMPSNVVDKIEALDNPSSKYDAEGVSGILNIKTLRKMERGFTGSVFAAGGMGRHLKHNEGFDINYRSSKFTLYGNFSNSHNKGDNDLYMETLYPNGTSFITNGEDGEKWVSSNAYNGLYGKFGADFYMNRKNVLSLSYRGSGGNGKQNTDLFTRIYSNENVVDSSYSQKAVSNWGSGNHTTNLNYEHLFDTVYTRRISFDFSWVHNENNGDGENSIKYYDGNFNILKLDDGYLIDQPLTSNIYSLKTDFEYQFTPKTKFDAGIKGSYVKNDNQMDYFVNGMRDVDRSNTYIYDEVIGAAYAMINHSFSAKTHLQVGLRTEATSFRGENIDMDSINKGSYWKPFPSLNLSQQIGNKHRLNLGYRYRLSRPNYTDLNPFESRNEAYTYSKGNPNLLPEYSHTLDLTYSLGYTFFATIGYTHSDGTIHRLKYYNDDYSSVSMPENIGKSDYLTISLTTMQTFYKIWRLQAFINGVYSYSRVLYGEKWENSKNFNSTLWLSTEVDILPTLTAELSCWGMLPTRSIFDKTESYISLNFGLKKSFLDRKLTLSLSVNDILGMTYKTSSSYPGGTSNVGEYRWDGRQVWLRASYRFGNNKLMNRTPRQTKDAEESSRIGSGGSGVGNSGGSGAGVGN